MRKNLSMESMTCSPVAYELFVDALPRLHTSEGLIDAATALSLHALDDADPLRVHQTLDELAQRVRERARSGLTNATLAHLHEVLFVEEAFAGDNKHYYIALYSYLPAVLQTKAGLPILLSLVYKAVGERVGLQVRGINAPGHFMVSVQTEEGPAIVDPFYGGILLTREEAFRRLEQIASQTLPRDDTFLRTATHGQWLARILANLITVFRNDDRQEDLAAMLELNHALREYLG